MKLVVIVVAEFFVSHLACSPWRFTQWMALLWGHNDPMEDILITGLFIIMNKLAYRKLRFKNEFTLLINLFHTDYCKGQNIPLVVFWNRPQGAAFLKALKHDLNVIFLHHRSLLYCLSYLFCLVNYSIVCTVQKLAMLCFVRYMEVLKNAGYQGEERCCWKEVWFTSLIRINIL